MWRGHLRDYLPAKVRRVRSDECAGELFAPQGERLKVCLGHGREVGGVGVHGAARDEVGHGGREPLVLHAEVDVDESCDLGSLADEVVDAQAVYAWLETLADPPQLVRMPDTSHFFHRKLIDLRGAIQHEVRRWLPDGSC